jgi:NAD(P)-dependent dehydrogenase (short-subunit alcohol dehydrogenase family)
MKLFKGELTMARYNRNEVALIVGAGPGISASRARLFAAEGMKVAMAARNPSKPVLKTLGRELGVKCYQCDAADPEAVAGLFESVSRDLGAPRLVVHNIDGRTPEIFRKEITEAEPSLVLEVIRGAAFSAFLVGQQAAKSMLSQRLEDGEHRGTVIYSNASAALKGYPKSAAFAMACHGKAGLTESMARELMPKGIHVAHVPIDGAIGWLQEDGSRSHRRAGTMEQDNMLHPESIAETYLYIHRQHRSTWTNEVVLRPWLENW